MVLSRETDVSLLGGTCNKLDAIESAEERCALIVVTVAFQHPKVDSKLRGIRVKGTSLYAILGPDRACLS